MGDSKKKYFGTDGIRGTVGQAPITPDFMLKLGWAAGKVFASKGNGRNKILIGKDTRISGYMFEAALEAGITAAGVDISLLGPMPTPAIAYLTRTLRAQAGIVISASHNGFEDNGIKFFSSKGAKLEDDVEFAIEEHLSQEVTTVPADSIGKADRITDASGRYIEFCKSAVESSLKFNGLKVVVDCAHGSTYHIAPSVFEELGAKVKAIGVAPDGLNINEDCGSTSPTNLQKAVVENQADVGVAFDGDGDRVIMVDHLGNIVDGDEILYVIARDRHQRAVDFGGVGGTKMTNLGLELALREMQIPFTRTDVGDRYVLAEMLSRRWSLGGESSGHIICHDINTTGDGIISALQAMEAVVHSGQTLADIKQEMRKLPQTMVNVRLPSKQDVTGNEAVMAAVAEIENELGKSGRVLLRPSGTEPVIRVMVEGEDSVVVDKLARELSEV
ncbi:MAG: phosphoglucosamine mutase, partial [Gammaproteobacteria bacterium]|nr:phosphoglucosamine mutase [Gammaproteobacteria bacterium]